MTETLPQAMRRRWRNIRNAWNGIDDYTDEHGTRHQGTEIDDYLAREDS